MSQTKAQIPPIPDTGLTLHLLSCLRGKVRRDGKNRDARGPDSRVAQPQLDLCASGLLPHPGDPRDGRRGLRVCSPPRYVCVARGEGGRWSLDLEALLASRFRIICAMEAHCSRSWGEADSR